MYPILFTIPGLDYPISSFGVMMAIAFLTGFWITAKRLEEEGLDPELASTLLIYAMLGGLPKRALPCLLEPCSWIFTCYSSRPLP